MSPNVEERWRDYQSWCRNVFEKASSREQISMIQSESNFAQIGNDEYIFAWFFALGAEATTFASLGPRELEAGLSMSSRRDGGASPHPDAVSSAFACRVHLDDCRKSNLLGFACTEGERRSAADALSKFVTKSDEAKYILKFTPRLRTVDGIPLPVWKLGNVVGMKEDWAKRLLDIYCSRNVTTAVMANEIAAFRVGFGADSTVTSMMCDTKG
jgi:hypothetical protein